MQEFFKSLKFKILAMLLALCFFFMLRASYTNTGMPLVAKLTGMALAPVQRAAAGTYQAVSSGLGEFFLAPKIADENERLRAENAALRDQLVTFERYKAENSQLKEYLEIKEKNQDFMVEPAIVIGRDSADRFYSFVIDKGSLDGITVDAPVITAEGLVGIVKEVAPTFSKVLTILDTTVSAGAMDVQTREIGITEGTIPLTAKGRLRMSLLPRNTEAVQGNVVVTTGVGGLFPRDVVIGTIEAVFPDGQGLSFYAEISPISDVRTVQQVMVIKSFEGQTKAEE